MSSIRLFSALLASLIILAFVASPSVPARAQNNAIGLISKLIQEQRALRERRRTEALAVKRMQFGLQALGYYDGSVDGNFGSGTQAALTEYRRSVGRPLDQGLSFEEVQEIEARASEAAATAPGPAEQSSASHQSPTAFVRADTPQKLDLELSSAAAWIVVASRETAEEAIGVADEYLPQFSSTTVIRSSNGRYAIVAGWLNKDHGRPLKDALIAKGLIPDDSFLSSGEKFGSPVWSSSGELIHSRVDLLNYALIRPTPALLAQLGSRAIASFGARVAEFSDAAKYLSLKADDSSSAKEVRRLPQGTLLKVAKEQSDWLQVQLLNGMSGWVPAQFVSRSLEASPVEQKSLGEKGSDDVGEQERRAMQVRESMTLLDDLAVYLKLHPEIPDIASIAEEIAKLQQAIQDNNFAAVDGSTQQLKQRMKADAGFTDFCRKRKEERREAEIKALGEATSLASKHKQFLRKQIAENVTSPNTTAFAGLLKQYEMALSQPDLAILSDLNDRLKQLVTQQSLSSDYERAMLQLEPERPKTVEPTTPTATARNRFLMEGDRSDWVFIFNSSGKAPSVVRNIRGEVVFANGAAKVCVLHPPQRKISKADVEDILAFYGVQTVQLEPDPCSETNLQSYDVLIALRGELLKQPASYLAPVLGQIEDRRYEALKTLTAAAFASRGTNDQKLAAQLENDIATGTRSGYGLIKVDNAAPSICVTAQDDVQGALKAMLLQDNGKMLERLFASTPDMPSRTLEAAFMDAKRGECGGILGDRTILWDAIQGFRRDNVPYSVIPLWFDSKLVSERVAQLQGDEAKDAQMTEDQKRRQKEQEELAQRQLEREAADASVRESALRQENGPQARARADEIFDAIKAAIQGRDSWATAEFPELVSWYRDDAADGWEYVSANSSISDFGTANWKSRPLEVVVTDVSIEMKNRLLGENKVKCFRLGLIFDAEFQMHREPLVTECTNDSSTKDWKQARGFKSSWVAP